MKIILRIVFLIIIIISFSCEEQGLFIYCADCTADEPLTTYIEAKIEPGLYTAAHIEIYEGNLEDNILIYSTELTSTTFSHEVYINKKYTITATYNISNKIYVAVDSATPSVKYSKDQCDNPCYFVYDRICNLSLKYTK